MNAVKEEVPKACIIGWPAAHSRSPMIHNYWLKLLGVAGSYERAEIAPEKFLAFLRAMPAHGFVGGNVTLPFKEAVFTHCQKRSATAQKLRAVNTLWFEDGVLCGDNTDVEGILCALDQDAPGWDAGGFTAVALGAGGAARAIAYALMQRGARKIFLVNRTRTRTEELAALFGPPVETADWSALPQTLSGADLFINTTSLGMTGQPPLQIDLAPLRKGAVVCDIVYAPLETDLLAAARRRGLRPVGGLGMLLHQAAPGFERWFGTRPKVTPELRALVEADIRAAC